MQQHFLTAVIAAFTQIIVGGTEVSGSAPKTDAEHIAAIEAGLIVKPIAIDGKPLETKPLSDFMKEREVPGVAVAVVDNYKLAWTKTYGKRDLNRSEALADETLFNVGSISKMVTAVAVLRLVDKGILDLDRDVNTMLKSWQLPTDGKNVKGAATLRFLMSHYSGVDGHFPLICKEGERLPNLLEILKGARGRPPVAIRLSPASRFEYSSDAFLVIQQILEDQVGKAFQDVVRQEVFVPAGMTHSTFAQPAETADGFDRASGHSWQNGKLEVRRQSFPGLGTSGLWTTARDLALLMISLQKSARGTGLLKPETYRMMLTPVVANSGLGVFLAGKGESVIARVRASDGMPQDAFVGWFTSYGYNGKGAVVLANNGGLLLGFSLLRAIGKEYGWPGYIPTRVTVPAEPGVLARLAGDYKIPDEDATITIGVDNGSPYAQVNGTRKLPMSAVSPLKYFINLDMFNEATLEFVPDDKGAFEVLRLDYPMRSYTATRSR